MELRQVFTRDIIADHQLTVALLYCIREAQPVATATKYRNEFVNLRPYEVLIDYELAERETGMSRETVREKIADLERLRRIKADLSETHALVQFLNLTFPINPVLDKAKPDDGIIPITFERWKEIDLQTVKNTWTDSYLELTAIALNGFGDLVNGKNLQDIDRTDYDRYVNKMRSRQVKRSESIENVRNSTINDYTRALKASFRRALSLNYLKTDPFEGIKPLPEHRKNPVILEAEEAKQLIDMLRFEWLKPIFKFAVQTGMRRGEINNLKWQDVDFENKTINIRCSADFRPKFGKERTLHLSPNVEKLLLKVRASQTNQGLDYEYVFVTPEGKRLAKDRLTREFKIAARAIGLSEDLSFHALRRTFATQLVRNGVGVNTIKGTLGHASTKTTDRYLGTPAEDIAKAMGGVDFSAFFPY
jgi:integrase